MRVLLLGGTGNLGLRLIPALVAHGHIVMAHVRSVNKLRGLISAALFQKISTYEGDALDSSNVAGALRKHDCDAIMNTAGTRMNPWQEQVLGKIATAVSSAAIQVGKERGKPLRAWLIGGMGSLEYVGTGGWKIQDYMPGWTTIHHRETEAVMKGISTTDLEWSLLCVAMMQPESDNIDLLPSPRHHRLSTAIDSPPEWHDHWTRSLPFVGVYLNLIPVITGYTTKLADVADLLAEDFEKGSESAYMGKLVGMKETAKPKAN